MGIAHNNVGNCLENLPRSEKNLMFFFSTIVACIINRTLRKHNTNEVKDSGTHICRIKGCGGAGWPPHQ